MCDFSQNLCDIWCTNFDQRFGKFQIWTRISTKGSVNPNLDMSFDQRFGKVQIRIWKIQKKNDFLIRKHAEYSSACSCWKISMSMPKVVHAHDERSACKHAEGSAWACTMLFMPMMKVQHEHAQSCSCTWWKFSILFVPVKRYWVWYNLLCEYSMVLFFYTV